MSDTDWPEVVHLMRTRNISEAEAWRIIDERADARTAALEAQFDVERCAVCGDEVDRDLAGRPTHVSTTDDDHAPVVPRVVDVDPGDAL